MILKRVQADLAAMSDLRDEIRGLPDLKLKIDAIYHSIFIGDGDANPPLNQRVSFNEKRTTYLITKIEKLSAAKTLGPKERAMMYSAAVAVITMVIDRLAN